MLRPLFFGALVFLLFIYWRQPSSSTSSAHASRGKTEQVIQRQAVQHNSGAVPDLSTASTSGRTVAVGDLHSDLAQTLAVLRLANMIDQNQNWSGGKDTLVQTVSEREKKSMQKSFYWGRQGILSWSFMVFDRLGFFRLSVYLGRYCGSWPRYHCDLQLV